MVKKIMAIIALTIISVSTLFGTTLSATEVNNMSSSDYTGAIEGNAEAVTGAARSSSGYYACSGELTQGVEYGCDRTNSSSKLHTKVQHNDGDNYNINNAYISIYKRDGNWWKYTGYNTSVLKNKGDHSDYTRTESQFVKARMGLHVKLTDIQGDHTKENMYYGFVE